MGQTPIAVKYKRMSNPIERGISTKSLEILFASLLCLNLAAAIVLMKMPRLITCSEFDIDPDSDFDPDAGKSKGAIAT